MSNIGSKRLHINLLFPSVPNIRKRLFCFSHHGTPSSGREQGTFSFGRTLSPRFAFNHLQSEGTNKLQKWHSCGRKSISVALWGADSHIEINQLCSVLVFFCRRLIRRSWWCLLRVVMVPFLVRVMFLGNDGVSCT